METRKVNFIFTSDVHGKYFPYDFRHETPGKGSMQRVHAFVAQQVKRFGGSTVLLDGGDILQGDPTSYYYNFVNRQGRHKAAEICNFIGYDVGVIGNHDIETGHEVFDKFVNDCTYPILGANVINTHTGEPYFEPYTILLRSGIRIAIIGFTSPAVPHWTSPRVWSGMRFDDIKESARHWIEFVRQHEHPDFIVGLFHSGMDDGIVTPDYRENAVRETVIDIEGFDLVFYGHDHSPNMEEIELPGGRSILCINPGSYAHSVAEVSVKFALTPEGKVARHEISAGLRYIGTINNSHAQAFRRHFAPDFRAVQQYASRKIGTFMSGINIADAYFGSSAYIDFIQELQLSVSHADLSLAAPLFFNASIEAGEVKVSDLFNLYRFEDKLYTLRLKGKEIKNYLEMSYASWTHQMHSPDDKFLQLSPMKSNPERMGFTNFIFNFDSMAGLIYTVDVRGEEGKKINIESLADGRPFSMEDYYTVAMTAYRANGGGELLTKGAGLSKEEIEERILDITPRDIRHYMMEYIEHNGTVRPRAFGHWRFVPEEWVEQASARERQLLFG